MNPLRFNNALVWLGWFSLVSLWGVGQADTLSVKDSRRGTIKVAKPDVKPKVTVMADPQLLDRHTKKPKDSKGVSTAFANDKQNKKENGAIAPEPYLVDVPNADNFRSFDMGSDLLYFNLDSFFSQHLGYRYPWVDLPKIDTVTIHAWIDKHGNVEYGVPGKKDLKPVEKNCFEVIHKIKTWKPARTVLYNNRGQVKRSRRIASMVTITIILIAGWEPEVEN